MGYVPKGKSNSPAEDLNDNMLSLPPSQALYDMQYEKSKTTLIQSVLLMGFWYSDTQDRTGPLHWIGVAISLCQSAGLHRKSSLAINRSTTDTNVLWRQLWWACVYRDAWYAVGQGKADAISSCRL